MEDDKKPESSDRKEEVLKRARKRFDRAIAAETDNRTKMVDDLRFKAGEQWDAQIMADRQGEGRPCLTINKMLTFVHQVTNDQRQNRPSINISPVGDKADKKTAQMLKGLIREIERDSDADIAYDTGFDATASTGQGYWRILTDYEGSDSFDQVIKIKRIRNQFTVYLDCDRQQPDGSDSKWGFVTEMIPREEFEQQYPDKDAMSWDQTGVGENYKNWADANNIRIAEYFEVDVDTRTLVALRNGHIGYEDELADSVKEKIKANPDFVIDKRESECREVKWYKITGKQILDERDWPGQWIPLVECVGDEIDIEGKVVKSGIVRHAKGPQQMYNYCSTSGVEAVALQPKSPFVMAEGQDEGHEEEWNNANRKNYSRLRYKPTTVEGKLAPPPQRSNPATVSSGWVELQQSSAQDMMAVTGIRFDSTLAERTQDESGIALQRLAQHQQLGAFHYIDNFARSLKHTGRIIIDLIPHIYDTPRILTILREDGKEEHVKVDPTLGKSFESKPDEHGKPMNHFNPKMGKFEVAVVIGPNYATKQEESRQGLMEFGKSFPNKADLIADLVVKSMAFSDSEELQRRLEMTLPPGMLQPDESDLSPQTVALIRSQQQQLQQAQQQIQAMGMALAEKQTDQAIQKDKNDKDFEAKMTATAATLEAKLAEVASKREAAFLDAIEARIGQVITVATQQAQSPEKPGNGAAND
jgi:hypothetical protein